MPSRRASLLLLLAVAAPVGAGASELPAAPPVISPRAAEPDVVVAAVPEAPALDAEPGELSKSALFSDGDGRDEKLPIVAKIKDCCGYPVGVKGGFRLSFYWLAYESDYANERYDTAIYTREGYFIGRYPKTFVYELKLEGSGVLRDGRVLNYDGDCRYGAGTCFRTLELAEHPLGRGVQGRPLEPFRSIAVDPRYIPIGSPIYVPELVGLMLPDGQRHDGCLRADDQGGAIRQKKMDYFVESYGNFKYLADQLWWRLQATPHLDEPRCEYLRLGTARERENERSDWAAIHGHRTHQALAGRLKAKRGATVLTASTGYRTRRGHATRHGKH